MVTKLLWGEISEGEAPAFKAPYPIATTGDAIERPDSLLRDPEAAPLSTEMREAVDRTRAEIETAAVRVRLFGR